MFKNPFNILTKWIQNGISEEDIDFARKSGLIYDYEEVIIVLNNDRWIPVTELLPEEYHFVIVTTKEHKVTFMYMTYGGYWSDGMLKLEPPGYVIAWMELPEEYNKV